MPLWEQKGETVGNRLVLAIDGGTTHSGVVYAELTPDNPPRIIDAWPECENKDLLALIITLPIDEVIVEWVECFGMAVGKTTFEMVYWLGRFSERAEVHGLRVNRVTRRDVKLFLCQSMRAKDKNIRQAIIDTYTRPDIPLGGGKQPWKGTKKEQGVLYKIASHAWSALALCCAYQDPLRGIGCE